MARFPLLLLLGIVFLASASASLGIVHKEQEDHEDKEHGEESESESQRQRNPYLFKSNKFQTLFKNKHGHVRILQRFDQHSNKLENLQDYRLVEFFSKPNTLFLPHHSDADFLLVVLSGKATLTLLSPDNRESYNLEEGDAQRIPPGTSFYLLNPDDNRNLKMIILAAPVNKPGKFQQFFLSSTQNQQSYLRGFSKNFLEASFAAPFEEVEETLLQEEKQDEGVIVKVPREYIRELTKHAKSSSRKSLSSEDKPFNLRSGDPIYSSKFGKFFEVTPEKNPQLQDLDVLLNSVEIKEGGLSVPHFNSKATVISFVKEGEANIEIVGLKDNQQQDEEEQEEVSREVQRYEAKVSEGDLFVVESSLPLAIKAFSDLQLVGIGINAANNQRYFLAGTKDNVIRQIPKPVKNLAFPGSGEDVEKLTDKQRESYFVDANPQQREDEGRSRRVPLSSILHTFH